MIRADCLINTTPVGMRPDVGISPVPPGVLRNFPVVMDVIYTPLVTKLLRDAESAGCATLSGLDMFVRQGAEQLRAWTGRESPLALMRQVVLEKLTSRQQFS